MINIFYENKIIKALGFIFDSEKVVAYVKEFSVDLHNGNDYRDFDLNVCENLIDALVILSKQKFFAFECSCYQNIIHFFEDKRKKEIYEIIKSLHGFDIQNNIDNLYENIKIHIASEILTAIEKNKTLINLDILFHRAREQAIITYLDNKFKELNHDTTYNEINN